MTVGPLSSASVTLDGSGSGRASVGPSVYGLRWRVTRMVTSLSVGTGQLRVYQNVESAGNLLDSSIRAESDTSETDFTLTAPDQIIASYSGGLPGAVATLVVYGEATR